MRALWVILFSISCSSLAHLALKLGADQIFAPSQAREFSDIALRFASNKWVLTGLTLHAVALVTWTYALSMVALSFAYPFIALGFVIVAVLSVVFLGETLPAARLLGIALIVCGVVIAGRSGIG